MQDDFIIPVEHKNDTRQFETTLIKLPYTYQLVMDVEETKLVFEPDDSGKFRMIKMPWQKEEELYKVDRGLIEKILETLDSIYG